MIYECSYLNLNRDCWVLRKVLNLPNLIHKFLSIFNARFYKKKYLAFKFTDLCFNLDLVNLFYITNGLGLCMYL